jgi:aryl-alcohol dehydrogenase-like predicted oxidoreductase
MDYSCLVLDVEGPKGTDMLKACRELGVAMVCAVPLGRGLLTSTFAKGEAVGDEKDMRVKVMPRFLEANRDQNIKLINQFKLLADKKGCSITQLALAWLLKQGDDIIPIPGTKRMKYLEENWGALDVNMTDEDEKEIRDFVQAADIAGGPLPVAFEHYNYRDTVQEA